MRKRKKFSGNSPRLLEILETSKQRSKKEWTREGEGPGARPFVKHRVGHTEAGARGRKKMRVASAVAH